MTDNAKSDKIRAALAQLDHTNDEHWTDDGQPKTGVVQRIANDMTIKRTDITLASPNFERLPTDPLTGEIVQPGAGTETGGAPAAAEAAAAAPDGGTGLKFADLTQGDGEPMTEEEVRAELSRRVVIAQQAMQTARDKIAEGESDLRKAMAAVQAAVKDRDAKFPPKTEMEAIKEHIASEQRLKAARLEGVGTGMSQLDMSMRRSNSRGWRRPVRTVLGTQSGAVTGGAAA